MLPPKLRQVREKMRRKIDRGVEESELLEELDRLDQVLQRDIVERAAIVSGPTDRCACCGR